MANQDELTTLPHIAVVSVDVNGRARTRRAKSQVNGLDASIGRREWTGMDVQWTPRRNRRSGNGRTSWTAMDGRHGRAPLSKGRPSVPRRGEGFDQGGHRDTGQQELEGT